MLQWARNQGCPWNKGVVSAYAMEKGHKEVIQWLIGQDKMCAHAASGGHLEVLQWAREQGCPWNEKTCANAARSGQLS